MVFVGRVMRLDIADTVPSSGRHDDVSLLLHSLACCEVQWVRSPGFWEISRGEKLNRTGLGEIEKKRQSQIMQGWTGVPDFLDDLVQKMRGCRGYRLIPGGPLPKASSIRTIVEFVERTDPPGVARVA